jgi:hypothetical protein
LGGRRLLFVFGVLVVGLALSAAAWADNYRFRFTAADQAAARAVLLQRADLGTTVMWKGGTKKPDLSAQPTCPTYHPKESDLVVTGAAASDFSTTGLEFDSEVEVLQTAAMVRLDWQRSDTPALLPCLRSQFASSTQVKLVSLKRIGFPHLATYTTALRLVMDITRSGQTVRVLVDLVALGRDRTEVTLTTTAPFANRQVVAAAEVRLARILVSRIRV